MKLTIRNDWIYEKTFSYRISSLSNCTSFPLQYCRSTLSSGRESCFFNHFLLKYYTSRLTILTFIKKKLPSFFLNLQQKNCSSASFFVIKYIFSSFFALKKYGFSYRMKQDK